MIVSAEQIITRDQLRKLKEAGFVVVHDSDKFASEERINSAVIKGRYPEERGVSGDYDAMIALSISIQNERFNRS